MKKKNASNTLRVDYNNVVLLTFFFQVRVSRPIAALVILEGQRECKLNIVNIPWIDRES